MPSWVHLSWLACWSGNIPHLGQEFGGFNFRRCAVLRSMSEHTLDFLQQSHNSQYSHGLALRLCRMRMTGPPEGHIPHKVGHLLSHADVVKTKRTTRVTSPPFRHFCQRTSFTMATCLRCSAPIIWQMRLACPPVGSKISQLVATSVHQILYAGQMYGFAQGNLHEIGEAINSNKVRRNKARCRRNRADQNTLG